MRDLGGSRGTTADAFVATIQQPDPASLRAAPEALAAKVPLVETPRLRALEVSLDRYPRDGSDEARLHMVTLLQRHFCPDARVMRSVRDEPRFVFGARSRTRKVLNRAASPQGRSLPRSPVPLPRDPCAPGDTDRPFLHTLGHNAPVLDATLYSGRGNGDMLIRIQNKITDHRNPIAGTWTDLARPERRARIEGVLRGDALSDTGLRTVDDLHGFRFQDLRARCFDCWLGTASAWFGQQIAERPVFAAGGVDALERVQRAKAARRDERASEGPRRRHSRMSRWSDSRGKSGHRLAFTTLNERHRKALERLSHEWASHP